MVEAPIHDSLQALTPVRLQVVRKAALIAEWNALVARWHPLGYAGAFGYRLRYFITAGGRRLGDVLRPPQ